MGSPQLSQVSATAERMVHTTSRPPAKQPLPGRDATPAEPRIMTLAFDTRF